MVFGFFIEEPLGNNGTDDLFHDIPTQGFLTDLFAVLGRHNNRIDADRAIAVILYGHLCLSIRTQVRQGSILANLSQATGQTVGQRNGKRHIFRRFIRGIAKHHALITGTDLVITVLFTLLGFIRFIDALSNIRGLFINGDEDAAGRSIKPVFGTVIADINNGLAGNLGNINIAVRGNFPNHMDLTGCHKRFTGNAGIGIFGKDSIQDSVRDLIGNFVRMSLGYGF